MKRVKLGLRCELNATEISQLIVQRDLARAWLGEGGSLDFKSESNVGIPVISKYDNRFSYGQSPLGGWTEQTQESCRKTYSAKINLYSVKGVHLESFLEIKISDTPNKRSKLTVEHRDSNDLLVVSAAVEHWQAALNRLHQLLKAIERERKLKRQAVIVVHGVGEQRPGQTLRRFVSAVFDRSDVSKINIMKPDYVSDLLELRRAVIPPKRGQHPATDVYELYWAHLIRDTKISQVYSWLLSLITSPKTKVPESLWRHIVGLRCIAIIGLAAFIAAAYSGANGQTWGVASTLAAIIAALPAVFVGIWKFFKNHFLLGYAGDAARYLEPKPGNVKVRNAIREEGLKLVDELHESGTYGRIVVYGHSLGSVIAYDILSHAWIKRSRVHANQRDMRSKKLTALEDLLNRPDTSPSVTLEEIRAHQFSAWKEYRENNFDWLVTDFVTAGSPLAHAPWLMDLDSRTSFQDLVEERSVPTCPPRTELSASPRPGETRKRFTYTHAYPDLKTPTRTRSVNVPHHAGLFALTRWSNLYFPFSGMLRGDPIAGPLRANFGNWIDDIELKPLKIGFPGLMHTLYTEPCDQPDHLDKLRCDQPDHLDKLRDALALSDGEDLERVVRSAIESVNEHPPTHVTASH